MSCLCFQQIIVSDDRNKNMDDIADAPFPMAIISAHKYTTDILETGTGFFTSPAPQKELRRRCSPGIKVRREPSGRTASASVLGGMVIRHSTDPSGRFFQAETIVPRGDSKAASAKSSFFVQTGESRIFRNASPADRIPQIPSKTQSIQLPRAT